MTNPIHPEAGTAGASTVKHTKIQPGDEIHLTILGAEEGFNFLMGKDRQDMLSYGRKVWNAALASATTITPPSEPLNALRADALEVFDGPETPQAVRDVIEWYAASIRVAIDRAAASAGVAAPAPKKPKETPAYKGDHFVDIGRYAGTYGGYVSPDAPKGEPTAGVKPEFANFVDTPQKRFLFDWGRRDGYQDGYAAALDEFKAAQAKGEPTPEPISYTRPPEGEKRGGGDVSSFVRAAIKSNGDGNG